MSQQTPIQPRIKRNSRQTLPVPPTQSAPIAPPDQSHRSCQKSPSPNPFPNPSPSPNLQSNPSAKSIINKYSIMRGDGGGLRGDDGYGFVGDSNYKRKYQYQYQCQVQYPQQLDYGIDEQTVKIEGVGKGRGIRGGGVNRQYLESQVIAETERLHTNQLIPSFRQKYQIYELLQQISQHKRSIQIKNKQIFYLSSQIVSLKDQYSQKVLQLQTALTETKKQLTQLRYNALKTKRTQSEKSDKLLDQLRKNYQLQIFNIKQTQQQIMRKSAEQHKKEVENVERKYIAMLDLQRRQKNAVEENYQVKLRNLESIVKQQQVERNKLVKEREIQRHEYTDVENTVEKLKQQFKNFSQKASLQQKTMFIQTQKLQSQILKLEQLTTNLQTQLRTSTLQSTNTQTHLQQTLHLQKQQTTKLKSLLLLKDLQITKLTEINQQKIKQEQRRKSREREVEVVRACTHHEALIRELERNVEMVGRENLELKGKLRDWGRYLRLDRVAGDRVGDLGNLAEEVEQAQQSFSGSLKSKYAKFSS